MKSKQLSYIELFAGVGGLAEGFIKSGFYPVAHIEKDKYASHSLITRLVYHYLKDNDKIEIYKSYLNKRITKDELYSHFPEDLLSIVINAEIRNDTVDSLFNIIEKNMKTNRIEKINVIAGGPPCQSYSIIGRARDSQNMKNDPRNYLYKLYIKFLRKFKPDIFVFENVLGLLSAKKNQIWNDMQNQFEKAGYEVEYKILNAHDFGVLQNRKRVIVIGWRNKMELSYPQFTKDNSVKKYKVADIFEDLPSLSPGEKMDVGEYIKEPSEYLRKYNIRNDNDILTLHIARTHNERDRQIYQFYIKEWVKKKRRPKYDELPEKLKTHTNRNVFTDRFKVVAPDLPYSQTVVAHLAKDGHYFIHPDIKQLRSISVREAARLQSFSDNFYFEGPMTAKFRQIGNAVPPLMAEKIAIKIKEMLV